jgi:hypothetical protein
MDSIEETMKKIILNDLDSIRKGTAGNIRDEHVIIANALSFIINQIDNSKKKVEP